MTNINPQLDKLFAIVGPVCAGAGYELVDLRLVMEHGGWILRVFIDRAPVEGAPSSDDPDEAAAAVHAAALVDLNDCERMSRELGAVLDVEDPIPQHYSLEVSSPGLDRPLRTAAHFRRFLGEEAKIALRQGLDGRRNFRGHIEGVEPADAVGVEPGSTVAVLVDGTTFRLPIDDIESARLIPDWDAVLGTHKKGKTKEASAAGKGLKPGKPQRSDEAGE